MQGQKELSVSLSLSLTHTHTHIHTHTHTHTRERLIKVALGIEGIEPIKRRTSDSGDSVDIKIQLALDISIAGDAGSTQRHAFDATLRKDLSTAAGHPYCCFAVTSVEARRIVALIRISSNPSTSMDPLRSSPRKVAVNLQQQISVKGSRLLSGDITCRCESIEIIQPSRGSPTTKAKNLSFDDKSVAPNLIEETSASQRVLPRQKVLSAQSQALLRAQHLVRHQ
jgi:hypothetical protein